MFNNKNLPKRLLFIAEWRKFIVDVYPYHTPYQRGVSFSCGCEYKQASVAQEVKHLNLQDRLGRQNKTRNSDNEKDKKITLKKHNETS